MADRSAWWRTGAGIAAWLVLAVATAAVAWTAVGVVADQGNGPAPVAVPGPTKSATSTSSPATSTPATTTPSTTSTRTPPTSDNTSTTPSTTSTSETEEQSPGASSRVLVSAGGTVSVSCTGPESIRLIYSTSADGWRQIVEETGPDEVEVEFSRGDDDDLRTRARCDGGAVEGEAESS